MGALSGAPEGLERFLQNLFQSMLICISIHIYIFLEMQVCNKNSIEIMGLKVISVLNFAAS